MTICALLLARQFYDLQPESAPEVRDARAAVRQRLDRRHADAFRGAAGADGGAAVGMGHAVHARAFRLARGRSRSWHRRSSTSCCSAASCAALATRSRRPRRSSSRTTTAGGPGAAAGPGLGDRRPPRFMAWTVFNAHYPALFLGGFLFFLGFARATAPYQSRIELQDASARRLLPGGPGDPRRAAGLVDCAGARQPLGAAAVSRRDHPDGVQRQRADHLSRDARAESERRARRSRWSRARSSAAG